MAKLKLRKQRLTEAAERVRAVTPERQHGTIERLVICFWYYIAVCSPNIEAALGRLIVCVVWVSYWLRHSAIGKDYSNIEELARKHGWAEHFKKAAKLLGSQM